jgi:hypothetical protein
MHPRLWKNEKATRQQGGLSSRENSSNGGKAIRTFWRNLMVGFRGCQGKIKTHLSYYLLMTYIDRCFGATQPSPGLAQAEKGPKPLQSEHLVT